MVDVGRGWAGGLRDVEVSGEDGVPEAVVIRLAVEVSPVAIIESPRISVVAPSAIVVSPGVVIEDGGEPLDAIDVSQLPLVEELDLRGAPGVGRVGAGVH